jgi:signal transduction histidine kinase
MATVADVAELLLRASSWQTALPEALRLLGVAAEADRTFLFECFTENGDRVFTRMSYEWVADGVEPTIDTPLWQHLEQEAEDVERYLRGEILNHLTCDLEPVDRVTLEAEGTLATLAVPVLVDGLLWGLLGFDDCRAERRWEIHETEALRAAAGMLAAAVERTRRQSELERRELILSAVATASERLLQSERWEHAIDEVLELLGGATSSSRAYMFETVPGPEGALISSMRHEWTADGIAPTIALPRWQAYRETAPHAERLLAGEPSTYAADEGAGEEEQEWVAEEGTVVYVSVPIRARGRLWGYVGFDDCVTDRRWSPLELEALRAAAGPIGAAMERELSDARLDSRERILQAVTVGAEALLRTPSWRDAIDDVLALLGRAGAASRCWLFECEDEGDRIVSTLTREWVAPGIAPSQVPDFWTERVEPQWAVEIFRRGEPLQCLRDELPPEAAARLESEGTRSIICVPVIVEGRLAAYIGYDDCETARRWSPAEEDALRTAASVIGSAMQRARGLEAVRKRERMLTAVAAAAQRALVASTTDDAVTAVLTEIGPAVDVSQVFASRVERGEDGLLAVTKNLQWAAPGFAVSDPRIWEGLAVTPERAAAFGRGERLQGLAREVDGPFREALDASGTLSYAVVPVFVRGAVWGMIGFNDCVTERLWDAAEIEGLRAAAGTLGAVIERELSLEALRESDERLWQAQKLEAVGRLAAGVAHDLRNYLTVIVSYATFMRERLPEDDRRDADALLGTAARVGDLVDRLLAFGRPQDAVAPELLDVGEVVGSVEEVVRALLPETQTLSLSVDPDLDPVLVDRGQLERVIVNLALNARDAMPGAGRLTIDARRDPAGVALVVTDAGVGMDEETQRRAFEPFFTTKAGHGTGLGLSMVYGIVTRAGGTIEIASRPRQGTRVVVRLPRATS